MGAFIAYILGIDNEAGPWYAFWSGFGSDMTEFLVLGGLYGMWRKHNCHVKGCWRIGRHAVQGTTYIVCRRHHPHDAPSADKVLTEHQDALGETGGR